MLKPIPLFFLMFFSLSVQAEEVWTLTSADWARPRHGEWLVEHPSLSAALSSLHQTRDGMLQVRYPGGDEGALWAGELQAWLIALGVESKRIELLPGSGGANAIQLEVVRAHN